RPQHALDHDEEAAHDPVLVEARDRVEPRLDRRDELPDLSVAFLASRRLVTKPEQLHPQTRAFGAPRKPPPPVWRSVRRARVAQVLRDRAQEPHLAPRQLRAKDEPVETVVLERPAPRRAERVLEDPADPVGLELEVSPVVESEVVDPDGVAAAGCD